MINKQQLKRICLIDVAIKIFNEPTRVEILEYVRYKLDVDICISTIEKDLFVMKIEFDAPLKNRKGYHGGYYYDENDYQFYKSFLAYWDTHIDFPEQIKKIIYE